MGNIYSAQNIAAFLIYELNEKEAFINSFSLQRLLVAVDNLWFKHFGHTAFKEETTAFLESNYYIKEIYDAYKEFEDQHLILPAKEWHLEYGQFQLVHRPYGVPIFTGKEMLLINGVVSKFCEHAMNKAS
ncbi:hypothetical protein [Ureibacillus aquaedulcis]|uniref:Antitoxin SocA-like Panacea domain-containing protein n=1 Tax=Ureibacillus aquaedulcis TaxID=3058421 RepID=A0ABT8GVY0_9BACL|nr:hypothetical protein [Ureibacillus sp. BA0131]MDN4495575.1 hypothetical protein [Ureibacillus sp. BA0131]